MRGNDLTITEKQFQEVIGKLEKWERKTQTQVVGHKDENYEFHVKTEYYLRY